MCWTGADRTTVKYDVIHCSSPALNDTFGKFVKLCWHNKGDKIRSNHTEGKTNRVCMRLIWKPICGEMKAFKWIQCLYSNFNIWFKFEFLLKTTCMYFFLRFASRFHILLTRIQRGHTHTHTEACKDVQDAAGDTQYAFNNFKNLCHSLAWKKNKHFTLPEMASWHY